MRHIKRAIKNLEFDVILNIIKDYSICEENKDVILATTPYKNIEEVENSLYKTDYFYSLIMKNGAPPHMIVQDIKGSLIHIEKSGILESFDIFKINGFLTLISEFKNWIDYDTIDGDENEFLYTLKNLSDIPEIREIVEKVFLDEYTLKDDATQTLQNIRESIKLNNRRLRNLTENIVKDKKIQKYLMDTSVTIRENRFVIPVKAEYKNNVKGLIHSASASGGTVFIEPLEVVETNNYIKMLLVEEKQEIYNIIKSISNKIKDNKDDIKRYYDDFLDIDISLTNAKFSVDYNCTKPNINNDKFINIKKGRHPLINKKQVVPIDVTIGKDYKSIIITGPNTGGKTVVLKTVGLFTLMALSGIFILANENSEVAFFDDIYTDIGDMQSIEHNLSTFSSHMTNIISIIDDIDENKNTLTLLDELGSGTDPTEGASLAIGIINFLIGKSTILMASTHYSEVKIYALNTDGIENGSCYFDIETLSPTYRFLIGVAGSSNAFSISKKLGLRDDIIDFSNSFMESEKMKMEKTIKNLETAKIEIENEKEEIEKIKGSVKKELQIQEEIRISLESDFKKQKNINREKAEYLLERVTSETNKILDDMENEKKEVNRSKNYKNINNFRRNVYNKIDEVADNIKEKRTNQSNFANVKDIKIGVTVHLRDIDKDAVVISKMDKNHMFEVSIGILKTKTHIDNISEVKKGAVTFNGGNITKNLNKNKEIKSITQVDVRGLNVFEATMEVDKFIDTSLIGNMPSFLIVHGKGTGALRKGIHTHLKKHKCVTEFRLGVFGEGEDGVTIVNLK